MHSHTRSHTKEKKKEEEKTNKKGYNEKALFLSNNK